MSKKLSKKHDLYMNSLRELCQRGKGKLKSMILPYQFQEVKVVAGHPALIRQGGGYTIEAIRQQ